MIVHIEGSMEEVQEMLSKFAIENKKPAQAVRPAPEPQMKTPGELPQPKGIEASFDHLQRDLLAQHMPEQERNVVGSALRKSLSQGQPVNPENNVDTDIDFAMKGGTIHPSAKSKRVFSTPLPHVYKPGNSNVLSPKDLKLPRFDYDKGLRKQHGLIFLTEMPDGRVVIEYGKAHYYTTKEKVLQIKYPFPEKYFSKENGWSSTAEMAFKKYREYLAQPQPAELKAKDPDPEDEKYKPMLKGAFNTRPGREDYDKIEGALEA